MKGFLKSKNVSRLLFLILAIFSLFGFIAVNGIRGAHADLTSSSSNSVSTSASPQTTLYVSSWFGHSTYALNASDGSSTWSSQNGGSHSDEALTLSDGIIYCGSDDGFIYAINSSDGSLLWKYQTNGIINSPPTVSNGTVYIGSWDGNMYAFDAMTGKEQWQFHTGGQIHSSPAVVNGVVYFGSGDGNEYAVNTNGSLLWNYQTGGSVYAPSAVVNGVVYIGSGNDLVYALRTNDGSRLWSYSTGAPAYSGATVVSGTVYIDSGKYLYELGADTGDLIRLIQVGQQGGAQPAVVNGVIYVGSVDSNIYAIRASDGTPLWQYTTQGFMGAKPVIVDNTIYMGGSSGLYALTLDGKLIWVFNGAGAVTAPVVSPSPSPSPSPTPKSITVQPTQGSPGTVLTATGSGWTPGNVVNISLSPSATILTKATVAGDGTFTTSFAVPENAATGPQFVNAKDETTDENALAPFTVTPRKLFVLLQGINSNLSADEAKGNFIPTNKFSFGQVGGIYPFLKQSNDFKDAQFMMFSYKGANPDGQLQPYDCTDTFKHAIKDHVMELSFEIFFYLQHHPNTDIYLIGHSLGGVIALGYLAYLQQFGFSIPFGNGGKLKGVVTLDSPLGGVSNDVHSLSLVKLNYVRLCPQLLLDSGNPHQFLSLNNLVSIFNTAPFSDPQGGMASVKQVLFGGEDLSNQQLVLDAHNQGIPVLTVGNLHDFLFNPHECSRLLTDFISTQWIHDEGQNSGLYSRTIDDPVVTSCSNILHLADNHFTVLTDTMVEQGLLSFLPNGEAPSPLSITGF